MLLHWSNHNLVHWLGSLVSLDWLTVHLSDESTLAINMVSDSALVAIGINQVVFSLGLVLLARFLLSVHISGMVIVDIVLELVVCRSMVFFLMVTVMRLLVIVLGSNSTDEGSDNKHNL